jgi:uncharacterized protein (DUF1800 family)
VPDNGWTESKKAVHALNRLAFGPSPRDLDEVRRLGVAGWIQRQLDPATVPDEAVAERLADFRTLGMSVEELRREYPPLRVQAERAGIDLEEEGARELLRNRLDDDERPRRIGVELAAAKLVRAVESRRQLQEVLVDFWFNHFNVSAEKGPVRWMVTSYERDALRPHVFATFRELLGATARHPAMLFYLDNWVSTRDDPAAARPRRGKGKAATGLNENYARELLELHTLGVDGGYTQQDVREVARCFTGWSIEKPRAVGTFVFRPRAHDPGRKVVLGTVIPEGGGLEDGERVLDLLAAHPSTARFIARKLARKFVSDDPPPELVERLADVFLRSGGSLPDVYAALFSSPEFWADGAYGAMTRKPLELATSAVRALGGTTDGSPALYRQIERMGEALYRAQPPTGYPESSESWVNAGALVSRINFGIALASNRVKGTRVRVPEPPPRGAPEEAGDTVEALASALLPHPLSEGTRRTIRAALGEDEPLPDGERRKPDPRLVVGLLLGSPEFQKQ